MAHPLLRDLLSFVAAREPLQHPLERRLSPRQPCNFGVLYTRLSVPSMPTADGAAIDLSEEGIGICGGVPVTVGESVLVVLFLRESEASPVFHMEARVVWAEGQRFGVRCVNMRAEERILLQEVLRGEWCQCNRSMGGSTRLGSLDH